MVPMVVASRLPFFNSENGCKDSDWHLTTVVSTWVVNRKRTSGNQKVAVASRTFYFFPSILNYFGNADVGVNVDHDGLNAVNGDKKESQKENNHCLLGYTLK